MIGFMHEQHQAYADILAGILGTKAPGTRRRRAVRRAASGLRRGRRRRRGRGGVRPRVDAPSPRTSSCCASWRASTAPRRSPRSSWSRPAAARCWPTSPARRPTSTRCSPTTPNRWPSAGRPEADLMTTPVPGIASGAARLLQTGGLTVTLGALVAACGESAEGEPGRVGYAPPATPLPTVELNNVVFLRTATSIEYTFDRRVRHDRRERCSRRGRPGDGRALDRRPPCRRRDDERADQGGRRRAVRVRQRVVHGAHDRSDHRGHRR